MGKDLAHYSYIQALKGSDEDDPHQVLWLMKENTKGKNFVVMKAGIENISKMNEFLLMKKLEHQNIVKVYEMVQFPFNSYFYYGFTMQWGDQGTLADFIRLQATSVWLWIERDAFKLISQLVYGMSFIHQQKLIHNDIRPKNIFISGIGNQLLIGDFKLSVESGKTSNIIKKGNSRFIPPVCFGSMQVYNFRTDVWAVGVVIYMISYLKNPFEDDSDFQMVKKIREGQYETPARNFPNCDSLIKYCLQKDPANRVEDCCSLAKNPLISNFISQLEAKIHPNNFQFEKPKENERENSIKDSSDYSESLITDTTPPGFENTTETSGISEQEIWNMINRKLDPLWDCVSDLQKNKYNTSAAIKTLQKDVEVLKTKTQDINENAANHDLTVDNLVDEKEQLKIENETFSRSKYIRNQNHYKKEEEIIYWV
ncbi:Oidioi.mRNA.OKI2018_I69.chr2.g4216.t1.cds [Oikopleura dioica]|uniref:Oidioi.mRNA.OKI2018_I69.chr2.g4216.t1.cds n=1 Tax=Oikopleura dioica TaxID=34765 RepID=A0ABN7T322_OIKDI|nr:Oidioi.mRNA.OKI2018_I69.chr2.g4216.t1.cds [Oikopleura dioica]